MTLPTCLSGIALLATLAGGLALFQQRAHLAALKAKATTLEAARTAARAARASALTAPVANDGLSETDRLELLRLRGEVTRLRARAQELAPVRTENQALREQVRQASPPAGYRRMRETEFAGQASPEAALQSLVWAIGRQDTNVLCQVLSEEAANRVLNELRQRGQSELLTAGRIFPGYRLAELKTRSATEVALQVEIFPGEQTEEITARLETGRWRLDF